MHKGNEAVTDIHRVMYHVHDSLDSIGCMLMSYNYESSLYISICTIKL